MEPYFFQILFGFSKDDLDLDPVLTPPHWVWLCLGQETSLPALFLCFRNPLPFCYLMIMIHEDSEFSQVKILELVWD